MMDSKDKTSKLEKIAESFDKMPWYGKAAFWVIIPLSTYIIAAHYIGKYMKNNNKKEKTARERYS